MQYFSYSFIMRIVYLHTVHKGYREYIWLAIFFFTIFSILTLVERTSAIFVFSILRKIYGANDFFAKFSIQLPFWRDFAAELLGIILFTAAHGNLL